MAPTRCPFSQPHDLFHLQLGPWPRGEGPGQGAAAGAKGLPPVSSPPRCSLGLWPLTPGLSASERGRGFVCRPALTIAHCCCCSRGLCSPGWVSTRGRGGSVLPSLLWESCRLWGNPSLARSHRPMAGASAGALLFKSYAVLPGEMNGSLPAARVWISWGWRGVANAERGALQRPLGKGQIMARAHSASEPVPLNSAALGLNVVGQNGQLPRVGWGRCLKPGLDLDFGCRT